jgi:hypothetical protein
VTHPRTLPEGEQDLGATERSLAVEAELKKLRMWREEAEEALYMGIPAMAGHARGFSQEALVRACALVASDPRDWTAHPETLERRRLLLPKRIQKAAGYTDTGRGHSRGHQEDGSDSLGDRRGTA